MQENWTPTPSARNVDASIAGTSTQTPSPPKVDASMARTSSQTPSEAHLVQEKECTRRVALFDNDYNLTDEDREAAAFVMGTHEDVQVAVI